MDNVSEYLPLLIIIASALISFLRKPKRPAKKFTASEEIPEPETRKPDSIPEKPVTVKTPLTTTSSKPRPFQKQVPAGYKKTIETPEIEEYETPTIDLTDTEEIKKAIIYSEIFNREDFTLHLRSNF
jgi:hypothetical protein